MTQFMYSFVRLQRLYQVRPLRMLDTAKKRGVTLLYWMPTGGPCLARNVAVNRSLDLERTALSDPLGDPL